MTQTIAAVFEYWAAVALAVLGLFNVLVAANLIVARWRLERELRQELRTVWELRKRLQGELAKASNALAAAKRKTPQPNVYRGPGAPS